MLRPLLPLLSAALLAGTVAPAAADDFAFFGDSLSDPGNHYIAFRTAARAPFIPVPIASYDIGGHHFTNGATWAEYLARDAGTPRSGAPALRRPGRFTNYAVGRARARAGAPEFAAFDLSTQVGAYLVDHGFQARSTTTYAIWIGSNDISDALNAFAVDPSGATSGAILQQAVGAVATNVFTLWATGAREFVILSAPDFGVTPAVRALGPAAAGGATLLSAGYNGGLHTALSMLRLLPGIQITEVDTFGLIERIVADPAAAGFADAATPCLRFGTRVDAVCAEPGEHVFWDGIHPTTAGHAVVAEAVEDALGITAGGDDDDDDDDDDEGDDE